MSAPIKREDIRKGDTIRRTLTHEYTAASDGQTPLGNAAYEYELIERPVQLPDVDGIYFPHKAFRTGVRIVKMQRGVWAEATGKELEESDLDWLKKIHSEGRLTRFEPVPVIAAEVLAEVKRSSPRWEDEWRISGRALIQVAAKFGVTK